MKKCRKCNIEKNLELFAARSSSKDGKHSYCKECHAGLMRVRYLNQKDFLDKQNKELRQKVWIQVENYRASHPCIKCGEKDTSCLDFHHLDPSKKDKTVSEFIQRKSLEKALAEIEKCVVLCANCHRKLHAGKIKL